MLLLPLVLISVGLTDLEVDSRRENQVRDWIYKDAKVNSIQFLPAVGFHLLGDTVTGSCGKEL